MCNILEVNTFLNSQNSLIEIPQVEIATKIHKNV